MENVLVCKYDRESAIFRAVKDASVNASIRKFMEHGQGRYSLAHCKLGTKSWLPRDQHLSRSWLRPLKSQDPDSRGSFA